MRKFFSQFINNYISCIHTHLLALLLLFPPYTWTWSLGFTGDSAWSSEFSSYNQHLTMELGDRYEIRSIATRGRAHTNEYVTEYIVQYSDDGQAWASYESQDGVDEVLNFKRWSLKLFYSHIILRKVSHQKSL